VDEIDGVHPFAEPPRELDVGRPLSRRLTYLVVQLEGIDLEAVVPRKRDALRRSVTGQQPRLDPEHTLGAGQPQHRQLRTTGLEDPDDSVNAHRHSMSSENDDLMNATLHVP
jgi:hypothetical protein